MAQEVLHHLREVVKQEREAQKEEAMKMLKSQQSTAAAAKPSSGSWAQGLAWPLGSIR